MKNLILVGGGGHALNCVDIFNYKNYKIIGFIDSKRESKLFDKGYKYLGNDNKIKDYISNENYFFISIGGVKNLDKRKSIFKYIFDNGGKFVNCISKNSIISETAKLGIGIACFHNSIINSYTIIKDNSIINTSAVIEHESEIGPHTHIAPSAVVLANNSIGENCFVGSNSIIKQGLKIKSNSFVQAGIFLEKDIN